MSENLNLLFNCIYAALAGICLGIVALVLHGDIQ